MGQKVLKVVRWLNPVLNDFYVSQKIISKSALSLYWNIAYAEIEQNDECRAEIYKGANRKDLAQLTNQGFVSVVVLPVAKKHKYMESK